MPEHWSGLSTRYSGHLKITSTPHFARSACTLAIFKIRYYAQAEQIKVLCWHGSSLEPSYSAWPSSDCRKYYGCCRKDETLYNKNTNLHIFGLLKFFTRYVPSFRRIAILFNNNAAKSQPRTFDHLNGRSCCGYVTIESPEKPAAPALQRRITQ